MASLPSSPSTQREGLTKCLVNNLRFHVEVSAKGRQVLLEVFDWLYEAKGTYIKSFFLSTSSVDTYESLFNKDQRDLLDPEAEWELFDAGLLFILLQNVCGLAPPNDPVWKDSNRMTLEYRIEQLKAFSEATGNTTGLLPLSDEDLSVKLSELQTALSDILVLAGNRAKKDTDLIGSIIQDAGESFQETDVKLRQPLAISDLSCIPQQEVAAFMRKIMSSIQNDCERELLGSYPEEFEIELASWFIPNVTLQPSLEFTRLVIKEKVCSPYPSGSLVPPNLKCEDVLSTRCRDGHEPDVLILSGAGGVGKSTFLKCLCQKWMEEVKARMMSRDEPATEIKRLLDFSPMLLFQLRQTTASTWEEMLDRRLPKSLANSGLTVEDFGRILKQMKAIVLLDGFDEAQAASVNLVRELSDIGDIRIVVTTRKDSVPKLTELLPEGKKTLTIKMKEIREGDRFPFVENILASLEPNINRRAEACQELRTKLEHRDFSKAFSTPLNLVLLIILALESPDVLADGSSFRDIYQELIKLIRGKVEHRRMLQDISDLKEKMSLYVAFHEEIAMRSLISNEHDLSRTTVTLLESKCHELGLPPSEVLPGFFTRKRSWRGAEVVNVWSYPHSRFQEQWAANHMVNHLLTIPLGTIPDMNNQLSKFLVEINSDSEGEFCDTFCPRRSVDRVRSTILCRRSSVNNPLSTLMTGEAALPLELKRSKRVQNLLVNTARLLAQAHPRTLRKVIPAILTLTDYGITMPFVMSVDRVLEYLEVSRDEKVLVPVAKVMKRIDYWSLKEECPSDLLRVLRRVAPTSISLKIGDGHTPSVTESVLTALSRRKIIIDLTLEIAPPNTAQYLRILTRAGSQCNLRSLKCRLSEEGVPLLPDNLMILDVHVDAGGFRALARRLVSLHLVGLCIFWDDDRRPNPASLPSLPSMSTLQLVRACRGTKAELWSPPAMATADVAWWCGVLAHICPPWLGGGGQSGGQNGGLSGGQSIGPRDDLDFYVFLAKAEDTTLLVKEMHTRRVSCHVLFVNAHDYDLALQGAAEEEARRLRVCNNLKMYCSGTG